MNRLRMALFSCGWLPTAVMVGCAGGGGGAYRPAISPLAVAPTATKLMIFGGIDHKTYLGCLNCSQYAPDSVENKDGLHGSPYAVESLFNHYGLYGSQYSVNGACNRYAVDPPVIVDSEGNYHGRLTLNRYVSGIGAGTQYMAWLAAACEE
jgi:hypothetical protein